MKIQVMMAVLGLSMLTTVAARADSWETNYPKALKAASASKKMVLLDFTGSDWCIWCQKLDKEVFAQPEFQNFARANLVLVKVDFPQEHPLPLELTRQNEKLAEEYGVEVFPTVIMLDSAGRRLGDVQYDEGGPAKFIAALKALR